MGQVLEARAELRQNEVSGAFVKRLASDVGVHPSVLYRSLQFFRSYKEGLPSTPEFKSLSWGSHLVLLPVKDPEKKNYYIDLAVQQKWSREQIKAAVKEELYEKEKQTGDKGKKRGELERPDTGLYMYEAFVERAVDGDTLIVRIDLGFDVWKSQRVRLRGVDVPDVKTEDGAKAKRFVEKLVSKNDKAVIRTYKLDKYGRYVADVFLGSGDSDKEAVWKKGEFLNKELLKQRWARRVY
jgi:endonuclease YncB( thermonuclease family)